MWRYRSDTHYNKTFIIIMYASLLKFENLVGTVETAYNIMCAHAHILLLYRSFLCLFRDCGGFSGSLVHIH